MPIPCGNASQPSSPEKTTQAMGGFLLNEDGEGEGSNPHSLREHFAVIPTKLKSHSKSRVAFFELKLIVLWARTPIRVRNLTISINIFYIGCISNWL